MKTSKEGIESILQHEGFRENAYLDTAGVWTIGYGTTRNVKPGFRVSRDEARMMFAMDLEHSENCVNSSVNIDISQLQFDALVSLAYNIGCRAFRDSTLLRKLNDSDVQGAASEFLKWNKITNPNTGEKEDSTGLSNRRRSEHKMFLSGTQQSDKKKLVFAIIAGLAFGVLAWRKW